MIERTPNGPTLTAEARRLYHILLRMVADQDETIGSFPDVSDAHAGGDINAFGALVDAGLIEHDTETGLVTAVLPFVAVDPSVTVLLDANDELQRRAAGTLGAFALPTLLGRSVRVDDECPICGQPVHVTIDPDHVNRKTPRSAVVVRVPHDQTRAGRYATARLACSPEHAQAAIDVTGNPDVVMQSVEGLLVGAREQYAAVLVH
ncbi:MAG TPA: organomercurial lyase [Thermomicrobiales bacterium]|nr:organomercurial lyase [Thermomicrobiales bacterium]